VEVDWDTALDITARKLRDTRDTSGADSLGILTSAKCLNEEKLPDEQIRPAGDRNQQHRSLRPSLTQQHGGRSGRLLWFGRYVQFDG